MTSRTNLAITVVLCSLLASTFAQAALNYKLIPAADYAKYPQLASARTYGNKLIVGQAIKEKKLPNTTYPFVTNNAIYTATNGTYVYYKFNLTLKNSRGDTIKPIFVVQYNTQTKVQLLKSSSASIKLAGSTTTPSGNTHVLVPASQYTDATIQAVLLHGVNYVANQAIAQGQIPKTTYKVMKINSIYKTVKGANTDYEFDVNIQSLDKTRTAECFYTINYKPATGAKLITKWSYKVLPYST